MIRSFYLLPLLAIAMAAPAPAEAQGRSSARQQQESGQAEIPRCQRNLGTVAIIEPDDKWWREYNLGSPEAILKVFVQKSGCFTLVNRGRSLDNRELERALADAGELQAGSNVGGGQVRTADYFLQPDIVSSNRDSGGGGLGGMLGGLVGGAVGRIAGGLNMKKKEANVTLSAVNARTTVEEALSEGYARKRDISFRGGGVAGGLFSGFGGAGLSGYQNTEIGQVIVLAYLDAYVKLVNELGGLPTNASAAAPQATGMAGPAPADLRSAYAQIGDGMSVDQVNALIGFEGMEQSAGSGTRTVSWNVGEDFILGVFEQDRLAYKSKGW